MESPDADGYVSTSQLFRLPFAFTQVVLLSETSFKQQATDWGHRLSSDELRDLHQLGLLVPFYLRTPEPGPTWTTAIGDETRESRLAQLGHLRDPATGSDDSADGSESLYAQWQLLGLRTALGVRRNLRHSDRMEGVVREHAARERQLHVTLAALTERFFPGIVGTWTAPVELDFSEPERAASDLDAATRLESVGAAAGRLREDAERLLTFAHSDDPLGQWWQVVRHSNHHGWFKLKGAALQAVWHRIAAEVLLRAHEELSASDLLPPLPSIADSRWWSPLMDRVGTVETALGLDQALAQMAVSPHPQVVLVVEGATEELHAGQLLEAVGISREVRVINQRTSGDRPHELARFLAPQINNVRPDRQTLERNPTALFIAMDPEGDWGPSTLAQTTKDLRGHLREEVERQGGVIADDELDELLHVRTWGDHTYELANFTDDELVDALLRVAPVYAAPAEDLRADVQAHIAYAREHRRDLKVVFRRLHWGNLKTALAEDLAPLLIGKLDADDPPPIIGLVEEVLAAVDMLRHGTIYLKGRA